jgi:antitoxin (DNA-binding transcriptional repressor) of toxin-antitoxin stability system
MNPTAHIHLSEFKTHCLRIINNLHEGNGAIIITKRSKPIAKVLPLNSKKESLLGILKGRAEIKGDSIAPISEKWDVES